MKNRIILIISIVSFVLLLGISGMIYSTSNSYYHAMHSQLAFSLKDNPNLLSIIICHSNKDSIYCGGGKLIQNREKTPINSRAYIKENGLSTPRPEYPRRAYALQVEGTLKIMFDVDDSGMTYNIKVVEEQPINMFKKEAIAAVSAWKFKPNTPISEVSISFDFKIDGQK